jgi:hypothetical protein
MGEFLATTLFLYITITVRPPPSIKWNNNLPPKVEDLWLEAGLQEGVLRR